MNDKNNLTSADLVIVKFFGESASEFYGDNYEKLDTYLKEHELEDIPWFDNKESAEFAKKATERFLPLITEIVERNRKSKTTFTRLKELIEKNNNSKIAASLRDIIESIETGVQGIFKSSKKSAIEVLNFITSPDGLIYLPSGVTRGGSDSKSEKIVPFEFKAEVIYECEIIHGENSIKVVINCKDQSKEFFITGNGFAQAATPTDGVVEFVVPDKGEYILSVGGLYFRALSLK